MRSEAPGRASTARVSGCGLRGAWVSVPPRPPPPGPSHALAVRSFSCTIFTFGQTGSGKTYTLTGPPPQVGNGLGSGLWEGLRDGRGVLKEILRHWLIVLVSEEPKAPRNLQSLESCILIWANSITSFQLIRWLGGTDELQTVRFQ